MTMAEVATLCLAKPGALEDYPFGPDCLCVKVRGRIVAQVFTLRGVPTVTFKCEAEQGAFWRVRYAGIVVRGYHCPPVQQPYWNTLPLTREVSDEDVYTMIDQAYAAVLRKLPKAEREALRQI